MSKDVAYKDLIAFHPGSYVEDIIDELNVTQTEFSRRLGTSSKTISKIVNGEESISKDIANKLAKLTGISIKTWLNLQNSYDVKVMEIENLQNEDEKKVCNLIDFKYFKDNGLAEDKRYTLQEKIEFLRKLFSISSLSRLFEFNPAVSYRNTKDFTEKSIVNSNIMLELAMGRARYTTCNKYQKDKLKQMLPKLKQMTLENPSTFYPKLKEMLLDCGIILVGLPALKNANLNGATKKFKNGSVLLLITDRNKKSDIFWFSLVHELGHIYNNDFYSDHENDDEYKKNEARADKFALDFFMESDTYNNFVDKGDFSKAAIQSFSEELKLHPSILLGRLQNDKHLHYSNLSELKDSYIFVGAM